jgi:hypothetical protein
MIRKSTFILLLVFLILAGLAFALRPGLFKKSIIESTPTTQPSLLDGFPVENLTSLQVSEKGLITFEISRQTDGKWAITQPEGIQGDSGKIEQLLSSLYDLSPTSLVSANTPLEPLGISPDSLKITLANISGKQLILKPGGLTPTGSGYFIQVNSNPAVVISKYGYEGFVSMLQPESLLSETPTP